MLKIFFIAATVVIFVIFVFFVFIVVTMCYAMVVAGSSVEYENDGDNSGGDNKIFTKEQLCPVCKTGKYTFALDPNSDMCPHINCWKDGKCHFYEPIENFPKADTFKGNENNETATKNFRYCSKNKG